MNRSRPRPNQSPPCPPQARRRRERNARIGPAILDGALPPGMALTFQESACAPVGAWLSFDVGRKDNMSKPITSLRKKAKLGDQGFPRATLAFYGPDDKTATKAVLGIFLHDGDEGTIHRYFSEDKDVRFKIDVQEDVLARLREHQVRTLVMREKLLGCPHEEGVDYPEGEVCPKCPYWKDRDRFA